jgi:hypothetical protein
MTVIEGELTTPTFDFANVPTGKHSPLRRCGMFEVHADGVGFELDEVDLLVASSDFEDCTFTQRTKKSVDGVWPQGNFGATPSTYRHCTFVGVRFRIRGGFEVGHARFEDCLFRRCRFEEHFSFCADYVQCRFEGRIKGAVFYAHAPAEHGCEGKVNEIVRNDFSDATFDNVGWRGGIDLAAQTWPDGYVASPSRP